MGPLLSVNEAAEILGTSVSDVQFRADRGEIPSTLVGGQRYFKRADLEAWMTDLAERERRHLWDPNSSGWGPWR